MRLHDNKSTAGWILYDWANSVFSTTVIAGFFPVFFKEFWSAGVDPATSTAYLGFANSLSAAAIALALPFIGALADIRPWKKELVLLFTLIGAGCTFGLSLVAKGSFVEAALLYAVAAAAFSGASALYDALLPSVARKENADSISAWGYAAGYLGGGVLFTLNVLFFRHPEWFGFDDGVAGVRASFVSVALWWTTFSLPLLFWVREAGESRPPVRIAAAIRGSLSALLDTAKDIVRSRELLLFVLAYWLYIDGVYSVVKMAIDYGVAIGFRSAELITALLVTQFVGFPAAIVYSRIGARFGAKRAILLGLLGYAGVVIWAAVMKSAWEFYALAVWIGLVQGGVQALSRSFYLRLIPFDRSGEYFGLLNLVGRFSAIFGPALVGGVAVLTTSSRLSILSLLILFAGGAWLLAKVQEQQ